MATISTHSKRKSRKRKYHQMMMETKKLKKREIVSNVTNDEESNESASDSNDNASNHTPQLTPKKQVKNPLGREDSTLSQASHCSAVSASSVISMPSPSKHELSDIDPDDIECDGLLLNSQKANLDELLYLIKGIECKQISADNGNDLLLVKLSHLINIGLWLKDEKNQLIIRGTKYIPVILDHLKSLSKIYAAHNNIVCAIIALLFILHKDSMMHFNDVVVNILIRFIRNNANIQNIVHSLKAATSVSPTNANSNRRSRRNKNKLNANKNTKMASNLMKLFENGEDYDCETDSLFDVDTLTTSTLGYLSSFLLIKVIKYSISTLNSLGSTSQQTNNDEKINEEIYENELAQKQIYCEQIMDYICHPAVIYKLACIVQIDCIKLESQQNGMKLEYDIYPYLENEFILLELITRNMASMKHLKVTKDDASKQKEKEALLKILDCIGLALRFSEYTFSNKLKRVKLHTPMMIDEECEDNDDIDDADINMNNEEGHLQVADAQSMDRLLVLILKVLTNITNGRNVSLKEETVNSILFLLAYFNDIVDSMQKLLKQKESEKGQKECSNYQTVCLILGCLINCCERNKLFRNSFGEQKIDGIGAIDFMISCLCKSRKLIDEIKSKKEDENNEIGMDNDEENEILCRAFIEYKVISYYVALLIGFLLQNTNYFIHIASKMGDLSLLINVLKEFMEFQKSTKKRIDSQRTMTIITKIIELAEIRNKMITQQNKK